MPNLIIRIRRPFPPKVGMGAGSPQPRNQWGGRPTPILHNPVAFGGSASSLLGSQPAPGSPLTYQINAPTPVTTPQTYGGAVGPSRVPPNLYTRTGWANRYQGGGTQQGGGTDQSGNGAPTQSDLMAFTQALEQAAQYGVITTGQVAQYQSAANSATDAQLNQLTMQLNEIIASTPSAAASTAAAAGTAAAATTAASTSWWSGTTSLFGSEVNNSTLVVGGLVGLGLLWAFTKKK